MSRELVEVSVKKLWKSAKSTPAIIVDLAKSGVKSSEKAVLDTAQRLGLKGSDVYSRLYKDPTIIDRWWKEFGEEEEKSAVKLLEKINAGKSVEGMGGVGNARHTVGCTVADELHEGQTPGQKIVEHLISIGYAEDEIKRMKRDVGF